MGATAMSQRVWKYGLSISGVNVLRMPDGAEPLSVQMQDGVPCLWALVEDDYEATERTFSFAGTGHAIPATLVTDYIGTIQQGPFVWHLFELTATEVVA